LCCFREREARTWATDCIDTRCGDFLKHYYENGSKAYTGYPPANKKVERRYYIAASAFYRQWGCGYKAHRTFKDANAFKVELTPIPSRPTTPRRRSSLSGSGKSSGSRLLLHKVDDYDVARLDLRSGLQYPTSRIPSNCIEWLWQCI